MAQLFHWPVVCTLCPRPAEYHCNTCGDVLCAECKDMHLKSNATKHHDVVPYSDRIKFNTSLQCGSHLGHQCGVWCQTCTRAVCGDCVTSPKHRGHHFLKLREKVEERKEDVRNQLEKYSDILRGWQISLQEAKNMEEAYEKDVKELDSQIVSKADEICREVREMENENRTRLHELKSAPLGVLQDKQKTLTDGIRRMEAKIKDLEGILRSNDSATILQYLGEIKNVRYTNPSPTQPPELPSFTAGSLNVKVLKDMFGSVKEAEVHGAESENEKSQNPQQQRALVRIWTQGLGLEKIKQPLEPAFIYGSQVVNSIKAKFRSLSRGGERCAMYEPVQNGQKMTLLLQPSEGATINIEKGYNLLPAIACEGSGQAWVQTAERRVQLVNSHHGVKKTLDIDFTIYDMAVTPKGDLLFSDFNNTCIRSLSVEGDITTLFHTKWSPNDICSLPNGDVVVACRDDKRVVQYNKSGDVIRKFRSNRWKKSLFQHPRYVAYSRVNNQLYVCDKSDPTVLSTSGRVIALDLKSALQYTYSGPDPKTFTPVDVCADQAGHVLITDYSNHRVHMLDRGGNFLQYLLTQEQGLTLPLTIDVDGEGYAWIGEHWTGEVKVVKYTERE